MASVATASEASELLRYVSRLDQYTRPFEHEGQGMFDPFFTSLLLSDGVRYGMVTEVEYNHRLSQGDQDLLQIFADLASLKIRQKDWPSQSPDTSNRQLILDLLSGDIESQSRLNTRLIAARWPINSFFRLLLFVSPLPFLSDSQWRVCFDDFNRLELTGIGCLLREEDTRMLFLLSTPEESLRPALYDTLAAFCAAHKLRCGCSNSCRDLLDAPRCRVQADAALRFGQPPLSFYDDHRFTCLVERLCSAHYPRDLLHPAIERLRELDRRNGSEYLETLRCLLEHRLSQTETADALGIHRTTLPYRLGKIREITDLDLSDSRELLHTALSLEMLADEALV